MSDRLPTDHVLFVDEKKLHTLYRGGDCYCEPDIKLIVRCGVVVKRMVYHRSLLREYKKGMRAGMNKT